MKKFLILILSLICIFLANIFCGAVHIPFEDIVNILKGDGTPDDAVTFIVLHNRLPQAITATLSGAALAVSGLMLQTTFRNPLAGPSILGITSGASLGVAIVMLAMGGTIGAGIFSTSGNIAIILAALAGSMVVLGLLLLFSSRIRGTLMLLITGIMTGYLASALVTLLSSYATSQGIQSYVVWGMGTFSGVSTFQMPWFVSLVIVGLVISMLLAKPLNILLLGDNYAQNLGINVKVVRNMLLLATGLLSAVVTAYCGPIGFIGLAIPHIARLILRTDNHLILIPATMLIGAVVTLACSLLSVTLSTNVVPINALTPLVGVPVVLYVIISKNK